MTREIKFDSTGKKKMKGGEIKRIFEETIACLQLPWEKRKHLREIFYYFFYQKGKGIFFRLLDPFCQNKEDLVVPFVELCLMQVAWSFEISLLSLAKTLIAVRDQTKVIANADHKTNEKNLHSLTEKAMNLDRQTIEDYFHKLSSRDPQTNMKALLESLIALAGHRCDMKKEQIVDALSYVDCFLLCPPSSFHL